MKHAGFSGSVRRGDRHTFDDRFRAAAGRQRSTDRASLSFGCVSEIYQEAL